MQGRRERIHGIEHETEIRLAVFAERGRNTENQRVDIGGTREVRGRREPPACAFPDFFGRNVLDIGFAALQTLDLGLIDIKADDAVPHLAITQHQGQSDIAEPDDADDSLFRIELVD